MIHIYVYARMCRRESENMHANQRSEQSHEQAQKCCPMVVEEHLASFTQVMLLHSGSIYAKHTGPHNMLIPNKKMIYRHIYIYIYIYIDVWYRPAAD